MSTLGPLCPTRETIGPRGPLCVALCHPEGGVMGLESSRSSYPSNEVFRGLRGPKGCCRLTSIFWGFHSGVLPMLVSLAGPLVKGTEFRNDLCHHLDDVTLEGDASNDNKIVIFLVCNILGLFLSAYVYLCINPLYLGAQFIFLILVFLRSKDF